MRKKAGPIPVNNFGGDFNAGILIERITFADLPDLSEWSQPERHDRHSFFLLEKGSVSIEIDFQRYEICSPAIIYMHPNQVHRVWAFQEVTVSACGIDNESLNAGYVEMLDDIAPAKPLSLQPEVFSLVSETVSLCIKLARQKSSKMYQPLLRDGCNTLIALIISLFADQLKSSDKASRFDLIAKAFSGLLERHFIQLKRPAEYAQKLNISTPYLNECVRNATGHSVSYHIQQRVVLEAKRLLYHSNQSVKEIAAALGFDDYPYFSTLFTKVAGMSPVSFRSKNFD